MTHGRLRRTGRPGAPRPAPATGPRPGPRGRPRRRAPDQPTRGEQAPAAALGRRIGDRRRPRTRAPLPHGHGRTRPRAGTARRADRSGAADHRTDAGWPRPRGPAYRTGAACHPTHPPGGNRMTTTPTTPAATGRKAVHDGQTYVAFERTFRAPIEDVWAAVTDSDR